VCTYWQYNEYIRVEMKMSRIDVWYYLAHTICVPFVYLLTIIITFVSILGWGFLSIGNFDNSNRVARSFESRGRATKELGAWRPLTRDVNRSSLVSSACPNLTYLNLLRAHLSRAQVELELIQRVLKIKLNLVQKKKYRSFVIK
jgi:hypothetical protein